MEKTNGIGFDAIMSQAKQQNEQEQNSNQESEEIKTKIEKKLSSKKKWLLGIISIISKSFDLIRSIFIRIVFGIHALVAICMVCYVKNELWYLVNSVGVVFLMIEWFVIAFRHGGKDLPWFSPSFAIYITTLIPPTWFLELENIHIKMQNQLKNKTNSHINIPKQSSFNRLSRDLNFNQSKIFDNSQITTFEQSTYINNGNGDNIDNIVPSEIRVALTATVDQYAIYMEVSMMLIIILGRWLMPKQGITRSELSQLLLVYMSLASDVIDLLSVLQEQAIMINMNMVYTALTIYSWSLYQFTLNLVGGLSRVSDSNTDLVQNAKTSNKRYNNRKSIHNELWNVLITLVMQDCPFFILRIICVVQFNVFNYSFLFFTFKNGILFAIQIYRIIAILTDKDYNFRLTNPNDTIISSFSSNINISMKRFTSGWARKALLNTYKFTIKREGVQPRILDILNKKIEQLEEHKTINEEKIQEEVENNEDHVKDDIL